MNNSFEEMSENIIGAMIVTIRNLFLEYYKFQWITPFFIWELIFKTNKLW